MLVFLSAVPSANLNLTFKKPQFLKMANLKRLKSALDAYAPQQKPKKLTGFNL